MYNVIVNGMTSTGAWSSTSSDKNGYGAYINYGELWPAPPLFRREDSAHSIPAFSRSSLVGCASAEPVLGIALLSSPVDQEEVRPEERPEEPPVDLAQLGGCPRES